MSITTKSSQVPKSRAPKVHFSLKTEPEHPKFHHAFMPSRHPKITILVLKDRYLSHASRRSGNRKGLGSYLNWPSSTKESSLARSRPVQELGKQAQAAGEK
ncbi:unnamed protein product [Microthlaspi erraticum]|uniref:Uncharacterized protein n=1 Tax=Microthlaspi erraticum TaxID=1685480 RepID=A0A6D2J5K1_9BRAS|nr:unnamed protein product [Microthlaspi erraticum]